MLNETERSRTKPEEVNKPEATTSVTEDPPPIELEDYALLLQHCSDPSSPEAVIVTEDFMHLLQSLPIERAAIVRYVFEQLADTRRGEGYRPPPDHTRVHRIQATIKLQRTQCSSEEVEAAEAWLAVANTNAITLQNLLEFHLSVSDANVSEDAEFVRFVQRMWGFDPIAVKDGQRGEAIQQLLENYTARCHLIELVVRKREMLAKVPGAQARIRSASALLGSELQHLRVLQAPKGLSRWLQCNESIDARLGETLVCLRELTLPGQLLSEIPDFVTSLKELQVLDLRDNRIVTISTTLGAMKTLRRLDLADNLLRDASFAQAEDMWNQLENLAELRLDGNKLTSLPSALVAIPNLQALDLSRNSLRSIRGEVIQRWRGRSRLVTLDLHANSLTTLPEETNVLFGTLRRLLLHQNHLVSLPSAAIAELIQLEELTLSQNQLSGESLASYPLPDVHLAVSLAQNQLRIFPRLVVVHAEGKRPPKPLNTSLTSIDVRGNRLRSVVDLSPLVLASCQALHLQNNSLHELPECFFAAFPALRVCELQNNQLRSLPVGITECSRLKDLHVHDNCLQSLPKELAQLSCLEVLNAAENDLSEIPIEWHEFERQNNGARVLHSLMLRRNPLRNKILKTIVDGNTDGSICKSDDSSCEGIIKKLLDGLRDASIIPTRKAWVDSEEDGEGLERTTKLKWRGVARDVIQYLEQRLRAMQRSHSLSASLIVDVKSFERLIRTLPFTCSKRELTLLVRRFLVEEEVVEGRARHNRQINGLEFLQAIERFGRWRSISMPPKRRMSSVVKPTIDSAGPIIQYLVVLQRRIRQDLEEDQDRRDCQIQTRLVQQAPSSQSKSRSKMKLRMKQKEQSRTPQKEAKKDASSAKPKSIPTVNQVPRQRTRGDVIANRLLEQQLVDQKLLLLALQKTTRDSSSSKRTGDANGAAIAPADLETAPDDDDGSNSSSRVVTISVKCLHLHGTAEREAQQAMTGPGRLDLRLRPDDSVQHLKQQLQARTGVPIDHQILIVNRVGRGAPAIRLRNSALLREYSEHVGGVSRWSLTMLIGQTLPLFSGGSAR
ncbi:hypothetical protein PRIC2_000343 [Phytophthora ramorum]